MSGCLDDSNPLFNKHVHEVIVIHGAHGRKEIDVHGEWLVRQIFKPRNGFGEFFAAVKIGRCQNTHRTGIAHGRHELGIADPGHGPTDNGISTSEHFRHFCLEHNGLLKFIHIHT